MLSSALCLPLAAALLDDPRAYTPDPALEELGGVAAPAPAPTAGFLSATLGDHMVLQRAPQAATVRGKTAPAAVVTATMDSKYYHEQGASPVTLKTTADATGTWRVVLAPTPASMTPYTFSFASSTGETASMQDVLFGDVYICGGQSNMEFAMGLVESRDAEIAEADKYPHLRLLTVGQATNQQRAPLEDLQTTEQRWSVANRTTIAGNGGFGYFSAVCWYFGKQIADSMPGVPLGLVSNNWGGTAVELWTPAEGFAECQRPATGGSGLYNAMIHPFTVGPMSLKGFTWYQGEANTGRASQYACLFPAMIKQWRKNFKAENAYFGFVQLSTWCASPVAIAEIRDAQMAAVALPNVGYATNADHGAGCNIHPPAKKFCGARLGNSALAIAYGKSIAWKSPTYQTATRTAAGVKVEFADLVGDLELRYPANYVAGLDCSKLAAGVCAWAGLHSGGAWTNATVAVEGKALLLSGSAANADATQYGYGSIPMMSVYDSQTGLPVLPWNMTLPAEEKTLVV
jgi:sialate O-acetylesterase